MNRLKRILITGIGACVLTIASAQATVSDSTLLNNIWAFGIGEIELYDSYLSPAIYSGLNYTWDATHGAFYKTSNNRVSWQNRNSFCYSTAYNPAYSAAYNYVSGSIGYASYYHFRPVTKLVIMTGGLLNAEGGVKYNSRNVNNIASGDINLTLYASVITRYNLKINKFHMGMQYELLTPIIGVMFVPEFGHSYYEMYENLPNGLDQIIHFSSFHNKQGIKGNLALDFILSGITLRVGMAHNYQYWHANNLYFSQNQINFNIGTVVDLQLFGGKKAQSKHPVWE